MIARRTFIATAAAVLAVSAVGACATRANSVDGTVSYRERLILPADSQVVVRLEDVTKGQAYPAVVTEQRIVPQSAAVTRFSLPYRPGDINPAGTYVVTAWIEQGGRVLFRNAKLYQVLTKTAPMTGINIELEQVTAQFMPSAPAGSSSTTTSTTTTTTGTPPGTYIVQPAPQQPGTYVVQPAPAAPPPGTVILQPIH
ncbi:YbaY family lipoprotein [Ferrovibrio xuzhouensis]|uniref:YbaY family lipoprotein n=1 Tax=Ferrovibrio xuzhouensis TaxID=1576914 RepID=A0ABV7VB63_9PROT